MTERHPARTPVNVLTGFLGAGKTTLLSRMLRSPQFADCAVLINEFGEVGLDHHLIERVDGDVVLMKSGCICCTVRGDLSRAIRDLLARRDAGTVSPFRRLVIETTGLADPVPVLATVMHDPVLQHQLRSGNVLTVVDAVHGLQQLTSQVRCGNGHTGLRVCQVMPQFVHPVHGVDGHHHRIGPQNAKVRHHPLGAVLHQQHHPVVGLHPPGLQPGGHPLGPLQHLAVSQGAAQKHRGQFVGVAAGAHLQVVPQRGGRWREATRQPGWPVGRCAQRWHRDLGLLKGRMGGC